MVLLLFKIARALLDYTGNAKCYGGMVVRLRQKRSGIIIVIPRNAHVLRAVLRYIFDNQGEEFTTRDISKDRKKIQSSVLQACMRLQDYTVVNGYKAKSDHRPMFHRIYKVITEDRINELTKVWKSQNLSDEEIMERIEAIINESIPLKVPDAWRFELNDDWELIGD